MGLYVKKSNKGVRIFHSSSDQPIHDGFLKNDNEIKKVLIKQHLLTFFKEVVQIENDYLSGYTVNGKRVRNSVKGVEKVVQCLKNNSLETEAKKILKNLKFKL